MTRSWRDQRPKTHDQQRTTNDYRLPTVFRRAWGERAEPFLEGGVAFPRVGFTDIDRTRAGAATGDVSRSSPLSAGRDSSDRIERSPRFTSVRRSRA